MVWVLSPMSQNNGYLLVASNHYRYYAWAMNLAESIKDYYPEAQICLVTEERFLDGREEVADHLIFCDNHYRAKLWGMANSPFDNTFYIDVDMEIIGEGIETVFDELGDNDMMFTGLPKDRWYVFKDTQFPGGTFTLCGGVCLYNSKPLVKEFMQEWYNYYVEQYACRWWPKKEDGTFDTDLYPHHLRIWDQFTLWWLTNKEEKYADLKIEVFENDLKWNYWALLDRTRTPMPPDTVLYHRSFTADKKVYSNNS